MTKEKINDRIKNYSKHASKIVNKGALINKHYALAINDLKQLRKDADSKNPKAYQKAYITVMNNCNHWLKEYRKLLK